MASSNRASFKSVLSRQNSYYSCADPDTEAENVRAGLVNEGFQVELYLEFYLSLSQLTIIFLCLGTHCFLSSWMIFSF